MNVSEVIKTSLKYPQSDFKNVVIFAAFLILFSFLSVLGYSRLFSYKALIACENSNTINNLISNYAGAISPINWIIFVIAIICSIVVFILINGYIYRIYEESSKLPDFNKFKLMFVNGVKLIAVSIVYYIIPVLILVLGLYFAFPLAIVGFVLLIMVEIFIKPIAVLEMVKNDDLNSAFKLNNLIDKIKEITLTKYAGSIIFAFVLEMVVILTFQIIVGIVMFIGILVPVLGILLAIVLFVLGFIVYSYLTLFSIKIFEVLYTQKKVI